MAMGMLVVPTETARLKRSTPSGKKNPIPTPTAMARKIQSVRKRSRVESFLVTPADGEVNSVVDSDIALTPVWLLRRCGWSDVRCSRHTFFVFRNAVRTTAVLHR
jgi:hypothetical protein